MARDGSSRRPRVLFLNRSYWPDAEATGQLLTELCEDASGRFAITVIAGQPNQNPDGAPFRRVGVQYRHGVEIRRVANLRFPKSSFLGRLGNMISYLLAATLSALTLPRPALVVVETDPPLLALLGGFLKHWHGCRLVVYLQDIYPDVAVSLGKIPNGWWTRLLRRVLFNIYARADRVVVLSSDMQALLTRSGVASHKVVCIPNWIDTTQVIPQKTDNVFRETHGIDGQFVVMYSGNMGLTQPLDTVLGAAEQLRDASEIAFYLVGDGVARRRLETEARRRGLSNVHFLPYQPKSQLSSSLSAANVHLVPLDPRTSDQLMPSKLYGVLASGTPVLAAAPEGSELSRITREANVGMVVPCGCTRSLVEAIRWSTAHRDLLEQMGRRARRLAIEQFDRAKMTARFAQMLADVIDSPARRPVARSAAPHQDVALGGG